MASSEILWHSLETEDALSRLDSTPNGLSSEQAKQRLEKHGPNALGRPQAAAAQSARIYPQRHAD